MNITDQEYQEFLKRFRESFYNNILIVGNTRPIFLTDAGLLWKRHFLGNLDGRFRQEYNCNACREFVRKYGSLCVLSEKTLRPISLLWDVKLAPEVFKKSFRAMFLAVADSSVRERFFTNEWVLGDSDNHFHIEFPVCHAQYHNERYSYKDDIRTYRKLRKGMFSKFECGELPAAIASPPLSGRFVNSLWKGVAEINKLSSDKQEDRDAQTD